jgi:peptidoglycan hydrolase-like protein with peptidoglycan-binding domain
VVVFDNKIWVMGGYDWNDISYKNDVWYSSDGINWILATDTAPWSERYGHTSLVFDNKIWVIGGRDSSGTKNDVWYSSDGINWFTYDLWSGREGMASVVFDNKIWVMGGNDGNRRNDVWYSSDGINWTLATDTAPWSERYGHTSVVFDNKIWVIGGDALWSLKNDVWYSSDGINWTLATDTAPWTAREDHTSVVFDNKIWVIGGWDSSGARNDVWYSSDGINWTLATDTAPWSERYGHTSVVFDNKIWVIGGWDNDGLKNDVWYSSDGINWTLATDTAPWSGRGGHTSVVFGDKIWIMGDGENYYADVWYSYPSYYLSGEYISPAIDTTRPHNFSTLQFTIQKPTSTDIKFQLSSSQNDITWTDFLGPDGTTSTFYTTSGQTINPIHTGHRYIRYKAFFETTNNTLTPSLNDITINYQYFPTSSFLISNPIDTNQENTQFLTLRYDEITPTGTQIIVYLRTANNLSDLNSAEWHSYSSSNPKCNKSGNTVTCDLTNPLPPGRYIQYKIEMLSDELNTPIFDNLALTYNVGETIISQEAPRQIISMTGGSAASQVKYLLQNKQYDLARKIILEYPHLFKRDYLLREYPNLFTQEELNFISSVLGEYKIEQIIPLLSQISQKQEQKQQTVQISKYQHLKEKLKQHPLKNELKNFRFKKVLKEGMRNKDVKYLQIILNLDNDTKLRDKGPGSFTKETEYFGPLTKQAVIKFQEKYKEDILKPINKDKGTGIVGIMTIMKLNEILEEITK